jgi:hypothetical protein
VVVADFSCSGVFPTLSTEGKSLSMKKILFPPAAFVAALAASALAFPAAMAHGAAKTMRGGVVQIAADLSFQAVAVAGSLRKQPLTGRFTAK